MGVLFEDNYDEMTKEELIDACRKKDCTISEIISQSTKKIYANIGKDDIMLLFKCENNKALRILKLMWQMGYGIKVGKEYYIQQERYQDWIKDFAGKEVII